LAASTEVLIGSPSGEHVLIRPLSWCPPGFFDYVDGNWIDCELQIAAGGFRANFRANLRSPEFAPFLEQLQRLLQTLEGSAHFTTTEEQIAVQLEGDGKGVIRVKGEARDNAGVGNRLQFAFDIDQTCLAPVCQSLEHLLVAFPVRGLSEE
jgi:hypothetical protein